MAYTFMWKPEALTLSYMADGETAYSSVQIVTNGEAEHYTNECEFTEAPIPTEVFEKLVLYMEEERGIIADRFRERYILDE
jgi:hypothetical protein